MAFLAPVWEGLSTLGAGAGASASIGNTLLGLAKVDSLFGGNKQGQQPSETDSIWQGLGGKKDKSGTDIHAAAMETIKPYIFNSGFDILSNAPQYRLTNDWEANKDYFTNNKFSNIFGGRY